MLTPPHTPIPIPILTVGFFRFKINPGDVDEVDGLFHDAKASATLLTNDAEGYLH